MDSDDSISDSGDEFELLKVLGVKRRLPEPAAKQESITIEDSDEIEETEDEDISEVKTENDSDNITNGANYGYPLKRQHREEDDFTIPDVFVLEGDRNSRIFNADKQIAQEIETSEKKQQERLAEVSDQKKSIIAELNDNGSPIVDGINAKQFTEAHNARYIDLLLKAHYRHDIRQYRHFYMYDNTSNSVKERNGINAVPVEHNANESDDESFYDAHSDINHLDVEKLYLWGNWKRLASMPKAPFLQVLTDILSSVSNSDKLRQIQIAATKFLDKNATAFPHLEASDFLQMVHNIGGKALRDTVENKKITMKFKFRQYNKGSKITLLRLGIIYRVFTNSPDISEALKSLMAKCFVLTISDNNLQHCVSDLLGFVKTGLQCLAKLYGDEACDWLWPIVSNLDCVLYDGTEVDEYYQQTTYNIIRLINLLYAGAVGKPPRLVCSLNESYLSGPLDAKTIRKVIVAASKFSVEDQHSTLHRIMALNWILDAGELDLKEVRSLAETSASVRDSVYHRLQRMSLGEATTNTQNVVDVLVRCHTELSNLNSRFVREAGLFPPDTFA